jgi:hypothetical protein
MLDRDPSDLHILPWLDPSGKKAPTRSNPQVQGLWEVKLNSLDMFRYIQFSTIPDRFVYYRPVGRKAENAA